MDMEKCFSADNCQLVTDNSCCLTNSELSNLGVIAIPHDANISFVAKFLKETLEEKEFVLFVGTAQSISDINFTVRDAATLLDEKDKRLNAENRVIVFNTSSFSGGLGYFVTLFAEFFNSGEKSIDDIEGYALFLANHIAHFFIEPTQKRWNNIIYVPRTGSIRRSTEKFRGNRGVYNHIAELFKDNAYNPEESVWVCCYDEGKSEAKLFIKQLKHYCPKAAVNFSHRIEENAYGRFSESVVACFFLYVEVRPDHPSDNINRGHFDEIEEKRIIAKNNITAISRYGQAFIKDPNPDF